MTPSWYIRNQIIDILLVLVDDDNIPKTYIVMVIYRTRELLIDQWQIHIQCSSGYIKSYEISGSVNMSTRFFWITVKSLTQAAP